MDSVGPVGHPGRERVGDVLLRPACVPGPTRPACPATRVGPRPSPRVRVGRSRHPVVPTLLPSRSSRGSGSDLVPVPSPRVRGWTCRFFRRGSPSYAMHTCTKTMDYGSVPVLDSGGPTPDSGFRGEGGRSFESWGWGSRTKGILVDGSDVSQLLHRPGEGGRTTTDNPSLLVLWGQRGGLDVSEVWVVSRPGLFVVPRENTGGVDRFVGETRHHGQTRGAVSFSEVFGPIG